MKHALRTQDCNNYQYQLQFVPHFIHHGNENLLTILSQFLKYDLIPDGYIQVIGSNNSRGGFREIAIKLPLKLGLKNTLCISLHEVIAFQKPILSQNNNDTQSVTCDIMLRT